jgi:hypothetical protein
MVLEVHAYLPRYYEFLTLDSGIGQYVQAQAYEATSFSMCSLF